MLKKGYIVITLLIAFTLLALFLWTRKANAPKITTKLPNSDMTITSPAFKNFERIPKDYTCDGEDINPPLDFSDIPEETQSLVLIVDDPDAPFGTWDHWIVTNIDPTTTGVAPNSVPAGGTQIMNSFGKLEYGGPCPPPGKDHRYFFKLYALDTLLDASSIQDKPTLLAFMKNHTLASSELVGLYSRRDE